MSLFSVSSPLGYSLDYPGSGQCSLLALLSSQYLEQIQVELCDFVSLYLLYWIIATKFSETFILLRGWYFVAVVYLFFKTESHCISMAGL